MKDVPLETYRTAGPSPLHCRVILIETLHLFAITIGHVSVSQVLGKSTSDTIANMCTNSIL